MSKSNAERGIGRTLAIGQHVALCMAVAGLVSVLSITIPTGSSRPNQTQGKLADVVAPAIQEVGSK